ncbi:sugar translocase [Pseudomonas prosekii]|uniref:Sugar translocase n=1 Tax=Pseudomonas prosekii TaxID=1148509 RepID=A0A2U2D074_9PSED|nr:GtrA family protein [Pseudomonas prosekii]PWE38701.1 sugar translocase [Pseudomonas prosekii]PWE45121.1 sugar translocase [Pseudomonas prosekii]
MTFWKGFSAYATIGVVNTLIHAQVFFVLYTAAELTQAISNLTAFGVAAVFSLYVNTLYTVESEIPLLAYLLFMLLMGVVSYGVGEFADMRQLPGLVTVVCFALISLVCGFPFSKLVLARTQES